MADTRDTMTIDDTQMARKQIVRQQVATGVFVANDTDWHVMEFNMDVRGGLTFGATNESNKDMEMTLYGAFESGVDPGGEAAFPIDTTGFTISAVSSDYATTTDKFPYYLARCKFADTPNGENVTIKLCSWESLSFE